jgi:hypothetical protein
MTRPLVSAFTFGVSAPCLACLFTSERHRGQRLATAIGHPANPTSSGRARAPSLRLAERHRDTIPGSRATLTAAFATRVALSRELGTRCRHLAACHSAESRGSGSASTEHAVPAASQVSAWLRRPLPPSCAIGWTCQTCGRAVIDARVRHQRRRQPGEHFGLRQPGLQVTDDRAQEP